VRAEILGIGTEILLGQIANTNAQHISQRFAEIGVDVVQGHKTGYYLDQRENRTAQLDYLERRRS
jgi:nicotinamide-nucleotide amidase